VFGNACTGAGCQAGDSTSSGEGYTWSCGGNPNVQVIDDGSPSGTIGIDVAADGKYIVENHTFNLIAGTRQLIACTLTVGGGDSDTVTIDIVDPTDAISDTPLENQQIEVNIAIEDVERAMYRDQQANGSWLHGNNISTWHCGTTGFSVWALANNGHLPTNDVDSDIYAEFVQKGIDYILSLTTTQAIVNQPRLIDFPNGNPLGNPDGDGNGRILSLCGGSQTFHTGYSNPIATAGIIAAYSATPATLVAAGSFAGQVAGDTYTNVVQDSIDWTALGQVDQSSGRGGWRYYSNYSQGNTTSSSADTSVDSWHYVATEGFEVVFGGSPLEALKLEAERRINTSQSQGGGGDLGQFGYSTTGPAGDDGNATTAGGLSGLVMVTTARVPPLLDGGSQSSATFPDSTTRKAAAVSHLGLRWDASPGIWAGNLNDNIGLGLNFYAGWTSARALRLNGTALLVDKNGVTFDWETGEDQANLGVVPPPGDVHEGYFEYLVRTQAADGSFAATVNTGNWTKPLNNAWGLLILLPTVFGPPEPECENLDPRTQGFWRRVCKKEHPDQPDRSMLTPELCEDLNPDPNNDPCEKARSQCAATQYSVLSDRLDEECTVDATGDDVAAAIAEAEALIAEGTNSSCKAAQSLCAGINEGEVSQ